MRNLKEILEDISHLRVTGSIEKEIQNIERDSRKAEKHDVFVAIKGTQVDGHQFIDVVKANTIVCEALPQQLDPEKTYVEVGNSHTAWAQLAASFYGRPAEKLSIVGITGTNGKTSVATLLYNLFQQMGIASGLISTIEYRVDRERKVATHTTPDAKILQQLFSEMVEAGCEYVFMEVSSHALAQDRVHGINFSMAVFTNITHDHLDYHGNFQAYIQAKKLLFDNLSASAVALINRDDKHAKIMVQNCSAKVKTFALKRVADYETRIIENTLEGLFLRIHHHEVWFRLLGSFNAYNLLTAFAIAVEFGYPEKEVLQHLSLLEGIAGRFEVIRTAQNPIVGIVDYSHTPDALKNVLKTLRDIQGHQGHILTVVGCGGDRDTAKRPLMGKIAAELSERALLTSDNPRSESPEKIIEEMYEGVPLNLRSRTLRIPDRKEAISLACRLANAHDVILVAGKGHETYQEIKGKRFSFDDREVLRNALQEPK